VNLAGIEKDNNKKTTKGEKKAEKMCKNNCIIIA
jgi:hypothetical protein